MKNLWNGLFAWAQAIFPQIVVVVCAPLRRAVYQLLKRWPNKEENPLRWLIGHRNGRKIAQHKIYLAELLNAYPADIPVIIIAPGLDWEQQLFQRPQQLAKAFARQGALVFYMQPVAKLDKDAFQQISERLFLCHTLAHTFDILANPIVYLLTWNGYYRYQFRAPRLIYDYVDDIKAFSGDLKLIEDIHADLLRDADLVAATAWRLYDLILSLRPDAIYCPNGVEYEHFARLKNETEIQPPADMQAILAESRPVVGYYGVLARWFDYSLLEQVADLRPDFNFVLIGPDHDATMCNKTLFRRSNVYWLNVKPYDELASYLANFDVAIIPFIVNDVTNSASPLKLFEYFAGGKPVVITPMEESMRYPGALVGSDPKEFATRLDEALDLRNNPAYLEKIDIVARENTWDLRARMILDALQKIG